MSADRAPTAMDAGQVAAFLAGVHEMVVAYTNPSGWPVGVLARAEYRAGEITARLDDPPEWATGPGEQDAICCVAEESPSYHQIKGVIVRGRVVAVSTRDGSIRWTVRPERTSGFDFARGRPS